MKRLASQGRDKAKGRKFRPSRLIRIDDPQMEFPFDEEDTMAEKRKPKLKLSDKERHERFKDMAREVEASEDTKDFDEAFKKVTAKP